MVNASGFSQNTCSPRSVAARSSSGHADQFPHLGGGQGLGRNDLGGDHARLLRIEQIETGDDGGQIARAAVLGQQAEEILCHAVELRLVGDGGQTLLLVLGGDHRRLGQTAQVGALVPGRAQRGQVGANRLEGARFISKVEQRLCVALADFRRPVVVSH